MVLLTINRNVLPFPLNVNRSARRGAARPAAVLPVRRQRPGKPAAPRTFRRVCQIAIQVS
jgi:hypothetical protein